MYGWGGFCRNSYGRYLQCQMPMPATRFNKNVKAGREACPLNIIQYVFVWSEKYEIARSGRMWNRIVKVLWILQI